ncbi:MAG TPA: crosslink repair DNA glycosylase YcaQ family protein [Steroidobacteraceae bacterium]|nr:crosslink repair DNA glycosylase YcaQ family protein [Steroidobacteraceae bacterium]
MGSPAGPAPVAISKAQARRIWLRAQRLDTFAPFGSGPPAVPAAVKHLGYVQIDTINVIERCHHHILFARIPDYRREYLQQAQSVHKSIFEYWTHALSYIPTEALRFYIRDMKRYWKRRSAWFARVAEPDVRRVLRRIRNEGALSVRDIEDKVLVDKVHAWASRKPSKHALELAFFRGQLTISARSGMVKTYELMNRHFGWDRAPRVATEPETLSYVLDRALQAQGIVSAESVCYLDAGRKPALRRLIERRVRRGELQPVAIEGAGKWPHWARPEALERLPEISADTVHVLSPFDPLINQRKRLQLFFDYEHCFEAYLPKAKRRFGYFVCPVLLGDRIVAGLDLKTDRERGRLLIQKWNWTREGSRRAHRPAIEEALQRFERFQLAR